MEKLITDKLNELKKLCEKYKVNSMYLFGSAISSNFNEASDLDFLIDFEENISIKEYTDNYFELHYQLQALFNRNIDLVTQKSLSNPFFIANINETKHLIYAA